METALIALVGVLIGATLNQWLLHQFQQRRFLRERLTDRYAEFVGFAAKEWNRARAVRGIYLCRESPEDESGSEELSKLYTEESTLTYDLMRTSLQVQL